MRVGVREGAALWRRAGPLRGSAAAARVGLRLARGLAREALLRRKPLSVTSAEVAEALGRQDPVRLLRGAVLQAMPTVARFEEELEQVPDLVPRADAVLEHRYDLLGSGPTELGPEIDWHTDFKSGRRWPLRHASLLRLAYGDGSDVKVPWELSRSQHLPLLAGAYRLTGERRYLDELGRQLTGWIAANPVELGVNWACTMDVAIRAANWVAALSLVAADAKNKPWFDEALGSLLLHGRFIRSNLEWSKARGNHYLANVAGLLPVAALFRDGREGGAWASWACEALRKEAEHQVRADGVVHEASTSYHRLVTELWLCGLQAVRTMALRLQPNADQHRLGQMLGFVRDYTRPDGLAPQIGDADDGRFLPLGDYGADPRDHRHLFSQAGRAFEPATESAAYPEGGFYVMRAGALYVIVRCGDVGRDGQGGHGHNDQLSFELAAGEQPLVVDPGTYLYTPDTVERNRFRSTSYHSTLRVGGAEQNELRDDDLFSMEDRAQAEQLSFDATSFEGRHHGFPGATHTRRLELGEEELRIRDTVGSPAAQELEWTFPLAPGAEDKVEISSEGLEFRREPGWYSPSYGVRRPATFLRASRRSRPGEDVTEIRVRVRA